MCHLLARWFLVSLCCTLTAFAQGTRADYERAAALAKRWENTVFRDRVRPHWLEDGRHFWYRVTTGPQTHEFVLVDAEQGRRELAFAHDALAAALRQAGVAEARRDQLPLERLTFDPTNRVWRFRTDGRNWTWDAARHQLAPVAAPASDLERRRRPIPRASRRTGPETSVTFVNRTGDAVELFWVDADGQRRSYGKLGAGDRRFQHTFAGHVWIALDARGQTRAALVAEEEPATVDIAADAIEPETPADAASAEREPGPGHSPDGRWQALLRDHNVWIRDRSGTNEYALTTDGTAEAAYTDRWLWSPDSSRLVAIRVEAGDDRRVYLIESSPADQLQPKLHHYDYLKPGDRVPREQPRLLDPAHRAVLPVASDLFDNPWDLQGFRWAADSSEFTFVYNQRGHQVLRVVAVDAASGRARAVIDERSATFIDYAGKQFSHALDATGEWIWMSERDGWNHLYLYDARAGRVRQQITRGEWVVRGVDHVDPERRQIWFRAGGIHPGQDPYHVHYARVNFDGSGLVVLTEGDGTHEVTFSPDRRFLVDRWSRVDHEPVTELRRAEDGALVCALERADIAALRGAGWRPPERFVAKGRDGVTDIYGLILRPTHFKARRRYPVIEQIYAGPQDAHVPKRFQSYSKAQALAELGFIVVAIDGMGTSNRSKKFHDVCWKNLADAGFPDRIAWLRAAAARHREMDLTRVGIYGGSAGGQNALGGLLFHPDFYRVGVADCGCHDNRMDKIWWNELWMGWPIGPHYAEQSNVTQAHRLQGKLLLIVGELDRNVDPASTMQVASALVKADKDFDLLVIPGAGHGAAETPYGTRRRQDFFVRHLLGVEPRDR